MLSVFYSAALKRQVLVDVFTLATLYTLRLYAGGEASGYLVSQWLLAFSGFLFLSLALVKRVSELQTVSDERVLASRGYQAEDTQFLVPMGIGSAFASGVVLALYVQSPWVFELYSSPRLVWLIVPLFIFLQCRLWFSACRGYIHDDPIVYTAKDWVSLLVGGFVLAVLAAAHLIC